MFKIEKTDIRDIGGVNTYLLSREGFFIYFTQIKYDIILDNHDIILDSLEVIYLYNRNDEIIGSIDVKLIENPEILDEIPKIGN